MNRRRFLEGTGLVTGLVFAPAILRTAGAQTAQPGWRHVEMMTKVSLDPTRGPSRVWLPVPTHVQLDHQTPLGNTWKGNYSKAGIFREPVYGCEALYAEWEDATKPMQVELVSKVSLRDRPTEAGAKMVAAGVPDDVAFYLKGTPSSPTDGIVLETALKIAKRDQPPIEKARAVYEWILENGVRDPNVTGCGTGDVVAMLETGNISGKCADLNGLFVALVRALGVPARDVYGIRATESRFYKTLGKSGDITKAQHCRAEFYLAEAGWTPADPADVLKVALEEKLEMESPQIQAERKRQFATWEGNWVGFNTARDVKLNPPAKSEVEFLMYPRAETRNAGVLNHLDPKTFAYDVTSRDVQA